jgi:hypothetical protein
MDFTAMTHSDSQDHRHFHRIAHDAPASVSRGGSALTGRALDLSLKGCLLEIDAADTLSMGEEYQVEIHLSDEIKIAMTAAPVHREGKRAGFKCGHIDIDSVSSLRRLVELNLGDTELLERDLEALAANLPS